MTVSRLPHYKRLLYGTFAILAIPHLLRQQDNDFDERARDGGVTRRSTFAGAPGSTAPRVSHPMSEAGPRLVTAASDAGAQAYKYGAFCWLRITLLAQESAQNFRISIEKEG